MANRYRRFEAAKDKFTFKYIHWGTEIEDDNNIALLTRT